MKASKTSVVTTLGALIISVFFAIKQGASGQDRQSKPEITITSIPPSGEGGPDRIEAIAGTVKGVDNFRNYRVVVYAFAGNLWWVQPTTASSRRPIGQNGNWETDTHLGRRYAAALVTQSFKPKDVAPALPNEDGKYVLAVNEVSGRR
jgi:hypothetical protein